MAKLIEVDGTRETAYFIRQGIAGTWVAYRRPNTGHMRRIGGICFSEHEARAVVAKRIERELGYRP